MRKVAWLLTISCIFVSGCMAPAMFSKTQTFSGGDSFKLSEPREDILDVLARTGKAIGYSVSGLDRAGETIAFSSQSSGLATITYGGYSQKSLQIKVAEGGRLLKIDASIAGNFGAGTQEVADQEISRFKTALLAELKK